VELIVQVSPAVEKYQPLATVVLDVGSTFEM
jgi:hypothetical protein